MNSAEQDSICAQLRKETEALLVQRIRGGLWLLLLALLLFAAVQWRSYQSEIPVLLTIKAVQLATILLAFAALHLAMLRPHSAWIGFVVAAEVCITTALSGIVTNDWETTTLLSIVLTMGTATLLPWGFWPQLGTVVIAHSTSAWNTYRVAGDLAPAESSVAAALLASATSLYVASALERYRLARRLAEERARQGEARKGAILNAALDGIVTIDHEGRILEFNPAAERTFGFARADVLGQPLTEVLIPPQLREAHLRGLAHYLRTGEAAVLGKRVETTGLCVDGREIPVELAITRIADHGPPIFTGYLRDLRERRLAEAAQASAALARVGSDLMTLLDTEAIFDRFSRLAAEVLECRLSVAFVRQGSSARFVAHACAGDESLRREILGREISGLELADLVARLQQDGVVSLSRGETEVLGGGAPAPMQPPGATSSAILMALWCDGDLVAIHAAYYDAVESSLSARQRELAKGIAHIASMALTNAHLVEELARADRVKSEFLSTMSHELRTPLNGILGFTEMVEDDSFDATERHALTQRIRAASRQLLRLIEGMLEVSRTEAERAALRVEPLWLPTLWRALAEEGNGIHRHPAVELRWEDEVPATAVVTDARRLGLILQHLVENGLKFTEQGWVRVTATVEEGTLLLCVADTGPGIAPEIHERIFELFRQGDGSETRRHGGVGLGLYLARRLVEELGGKIWVESAPGCGARFFVRLPGTAAHEGTKDVASSPTRPQLPREDAA